MGFSCVHITVALAPFSSAARLYIGSPDTSSPDAQSLFLDTASTSVLPSDKALIRLCDVTRNACRSGVRSLRTWHDSLCRCSCPRHQLRYEAPRTPHGGDDATSLALGLELVCVQRYSVDSTECLQI